MTETGPVVVAKVPIYQRGLKQDAKGELVVAGKEKDGTTVYRLGKKKIGEFEAAVSLSVEETGSGRACNIKVMTPWELPKQPNPNGTYQFQAFNITNKEAAPYLKVLGKEQDFCAEPIRLDVARLVLTGEAVKGKTVKAK
jgi:hypothetical protein